MTVNTEIDPFAGTDSRPSVSFKDKPIGTAYTLQVDEAPQLVQARDFDSGEPAFWPDGNKKMTVVTAVTDTATGEQLSLWAAKPSALFRAIGEVQKTSGRITPGGTLTVTFSGEKPNPEKPRMNAQKLYTVTYQSGDAFADATPAAAPAPAPVAQPAAAPAPQVDDEAAQMAAFLAWTKSQKAS